MTTEAQAAKTKHTPGPWEVVTEGHRLSVWADGYGFVHTTEVPQVNVGATETANANAHLIAAAPELLAALTDMLDSTVNRSGGQWTDGEIAVACKFARESIAKAEGR